MFQILIVDDEHIERKGITRLIQKYGLELEATEAENGEEALEILASRPIDILFTDIKMPFMDGLELCRRARELYSDIHIIIFSAFGEFEYAQQAIQYRIFAYLLKPIDVNDFVRQFESVIAHCKKQQAERERSRTMLAGYHKGMEYEKENVLLGLIGGRDVTAEQLAQAGIAIPGSGIQMILVDVDGPVFAEDHDRFPASVQSLIDSVFEIVNLNESQSVLLLFRTPCQEGFEEPSALGGRLMQAWTDLYGRNVNLVMGRPVADITAIADEFGSMERTLEEKFFFQESTVLFTDERLANRDLSDALPKLMETIDWHMDAKDNFGFRKGVELFFKTIEGNGRHSAIFVKYLCTELAKRVLSAAGERDVLAFKPYVEDIFGCRSLSALKSHLYRLMDLLQMSGEANPPDTKKVIDDVKRLIDDHYMEDIGLGWLAERVFLTQTYLSYLFNKEAGLTLVKYITKVRMLKAAELLRHTNMTIADIGAKVGYLNDSYFCKIFKNHHGISPAKFRETRR